MAAIAASDKGKYQYIDYGDADGVVTGQVVSSPVGFYGFTPVSQAASIASAACSAISNTADFNDELVKINSVITALGALGLIATSS